MVRSKNMLKNQRPKKRTAAAQQVSGFWRKFFLLALTGTTVVFAVYALWIRYAASPVDLFRTSHHLRGDGSAPSPSLSSSSSALSSTSQPQLRVSVRAAAGAVQDQSVMDEIFQQSVKRLRTAHRDELQLLAQYLLRESRFDRVTITRPNPQHVVVEVRTPEAVALIQADTWRWLSANGNVFGTADLQHQGPLPQVTGVFAEMSQKSYVMSASNKLILPPEKMRVLQMIKSALGEIQQRSLELESLHYDSYRGISLRLKNRILITLGHPPFEEKLERLVAIFKQAQMAGETITRVELDYKGKAFVQKGPSAPSPSTHTFSVDVQGRY